MHIYVATDQRRFVHKLAIEKHSSHITEGGSKIASGLSEEDANAHTILLAGLWRDEARAADVRWTLMQRRSAVIDSVVEASQQRCRDAMSSVRVSIPGLLSVAERVLAEERT